MADANDDFTNSPRSAFFGAQRLNSNPRIHKIQKPYSRPVSYNDSIPNNALALQTGSPAAKAVTTAQTTRSIPKSNSSNSVNNKLTRSNSDHSLFAGIKSILSKPLSWLATPSKELGHHQGTKRDSTTSFVNGNAGEDPEDPPSPTSKREGKRPRRDDSQSQQRISIQGRAVTGYMLPPLPAGVSLEARGGDQSGAGNRNTNFSRPLASSKSMPYLDPPAHALSPRKQPRNQPSVDEFGSTGNSGAKGSWSPWKDRYRNSMTPQRLTREKTLPSMSPFRAAHGSPAPARETLGGSGMIRRSATINNLNRASSVATDVSMRESVPRQTLFEDERMSVSGDREGSVLDWFMKDRWRETGSPATMGASASRRLGGTPSATPNRRGQMVWVENHGFAREGDIQESTPKPVEKNDAERILFALENIRKTPLADARSSIPPELVGTSSRNLRRAINVPLATAQAGDTAKRRRDKERLGEDYNVMISPYGRRREVDKAVRDVQRARSTSEMQDDRMDEDRSVAAASERSRTRSERMTESVSPAPRRSARINRSPSKEPEPAPTPRRNTRKGSASVKNAAVESTTPKTSNRKQRKTTVDRATSPPPVPSVPTITETAPSPSSKSTTSSYAPRADDAVPRERSSLRAKTEVTKRTHTGSASYQNSRANSPSSGRFSAREEDLPNMEELEQQPKISFGALSGLNLLAPTTEKDKPQQPPQPAKQTLGIPKSNPLSRLNASRPRSSSPLASGSSIIAAPESPPTTRKPSNDPPAPAVVAPAPTPAAPVPTDTGFGFYPISTPGSGTTTPKPLFAGVPAQGEKDKKSATGLGLGKPSEKSSASASGGMPTFFANKSAPESLAVTQPASTGAFDFGINKSAEAAPAMKVTGMTFAQTGDAPATTASLFGNKSADTPAPSFGAFGNKSDLSKSAPFATPNAPSSTPPAGSDKPEAAKSFAFGSPSAAPATTSPFAFGKPPATTEENTEPAKPAFGNMFASTTAKPAESTPTNLFGGTANPKPAEATPEVSKPPFAFGAPSAKPAETPSLQNNGFSFNAPTPKQDESSAKAAEEPKAASLFGSGTSSGFTGFNSSNAKSVEAPKASTGMFGGPSANPFPTFGSTAKPAEVASTTTPASTTNMFAQPNTTAPASNGFGSSFSAPSSTAPLFGAKPAEAPSTTSNNVFGGNNTTTAAASPSLFAFGSNSQANGAPAGSTLFSATNTSTPGANPFTTPSQPNSATSVSFGFGSQNQTQSQPPANGFGSTATSSPAFGTSSPSSFTFQAGKTNTTPAPPTPGGTTQPFVFGAPGNQPPSTPTNNGTMATFGGTSGGFGSTNNTPAAPTFGGGFNQAPPATPGLTNGTPGAGGGGFNFGGTPGPDAARFGSPGPADGGFSLGTGGDPVPASPRRIRAMPKKGAKR